VHNEAEPTLTSITMTTAHSGVDLRVSLGPDTPATMALLLAGDDAALPRSEQPLVEILAAGFGRNFSGPRYVDTDLGSRLRYVRHTLQRDGLWQTLSVVQLDPQSSVQVTSVLAVHDEHRAVRAYSNVSNTGAEPITLHAVTSLVFADFHWISPTSIDGMSILRGRSDWLAEGRWTQAELRDAGLPALTHHGRPFRTRGCIEATSVSSWPTSQELPMAVVSNRAAGRSWAWQIEHNGGWLWQVGEVVDGLYLALLGPTDEQHQWQLKLGPGEFFDTVPVSLAVGLGDAQSAVASLTEFRRGHADLRSDEQHLPVVFNDYMNTVMGDPSAARLHPLVDSAAAAGAEYFVIDAGWYADGEDWWDGVGEWQPSTRRFPQGIGAVLGHIRERGMVPGLWLEPEVVGVNSPMALKLPDRAFLSRDGVRVVDHGRFHLDLSSDAARAFLDEVVDRLVSDLGIGYFKFDYNIRAGVGSDGVSASPGHGLLLHNRGYLAWVDALKQRHPDVVLENCASGGMRQDFATVSRFDLQSTSDQENLHAYAVVAASAPMLVPPERAGNWAYPQPGMSDDDVTFTLCTALLGRFYLSGWLHELTDNQRQLVSDAVQAHKGIRNLMPQTTPFWPLGLPGWSDEWVSLGLRDDANDSLFITIWRRASSAGTATMSLPVPPTGRSWAAPQSIFPTSSPLSVSLSGNEMTVHDSVGVHVARVVTLSALSAH
jgi:alpha-galactosidase